MDIAEVVPDVTEGDIILTNVNAVLGLHEQAQSAIIYQADSGATATYTCTGSTLDYACALNGGEPTLY